MTMNGQVIIRTLVVVVLVAQTCQAQHSHHMKRQGGGGPQPPQLHLEVASDKAFTNSYQHISTPEYHMSQSDNVAFNFTCNIKNPAHKYKLTMTKEQILSDGTRAPPENLIDPDNIENVSPEIRKKFGTRYSIDYSDWEPRTLRISLIIKGMKLEDNGLYACKYSNISKSINAHVYKSPQMEDIKFGEDIKSTKPVEKLDLKVGQPTKLHCHVNDVYPKPRVTFHHSGHQLSNKDYVEKSPPIEKNRYSYSVTSTYSFTPTHLDSNKNLYCEVKMGSNKTLTKQIKLHVTGVMLVDNECRESQGANLNSPGTHKVECLFFSNPKYTTVYFETVRDNVTDEEIQQYNKHLAEMASTVQTPPAANPTGFKPPQKGGINPNTVAPSTAAPPNIMVRISENTPTDNYALSIEPVDDTPGLFRAVLKINQLRDQDFKNYTFRTDKLHREIKLFKGTRDMALSGQDNHAASMQTSHSARILLLVLTSLLAALLFNMSL